MNGQLTVLQGFDPSAWVERLLKAAYTDNVSSCVLQEQ